MSYEREKWEHYGLRLPRRVLEHVRQKAAAEDRLIAEVMREAIYKGLDLPAKA